MILLRSDELTANVDPAATEGGVEMAGGGSSTKGEAGTAATRRMEHARRVRAPRMHAARQVRPVRARHRKAKDRYSFDVAHIYNSDVIYKNQMLTYVDFPNFVAVMFCIDSRFQSA